MDYVIYTHLDTVLCLSQMQDFIHLPPQGAVRSILCDASGRPAETEYFTVEPLGGARIGLRTDQGYLCAEPNGKISTSPHLKSWETFYLGPASELERAKLDHKPQLPNKPRAMRIERVIHQTYYTRAIPEQAQENVAALRHLNPGWMYRYWSHQDQHDFIYQFFGWDILKLYLRINPRYGAARADLFRYLCIYQFGGVYLDIKSGSTVPFEDILLPGDQFLLSQWHNGPGEEFYGWGIHSDLSSIPRGEFQMWHIIAAAGHPFLEHVLNAVFANIVKYSADVNYVGKQGVLRLTGPIAYTLAIHPRLIYYENRIFDAAQAGLIPAAVKMRQEGEYGHYSIQDTPVVL